MRSSRLASDRLASPLHVRRRISERRAVRTAVFLLIAALLPVSSADEKRIAVYASGTTYSLPVTERNGIEYIGMLEAIEPLGTVSSRGDGVHWKLRYDDVESEFAAGKNRAKIRGHDIDLTANFLLENGRGLVPVTSLSALLPRIIGGQVVFNPASRRLFLGNVATHFTAQLSRTTPARLVMNFTSPVNPTIATEPGRLRMTFNREPVVAPGTPTLTFDDKAIPSATYLEGNGVAEITVNGTVPLMASFSNEGRTITIAPAPQQLAGPTPPPPPPGAPPPAAPAPKPGYPPQAPAAPVAIAPRPVYVVVDAGHGGDDRGAALNDKLAEKDVTLALARRLRQEFESQGVSTQLLRDSDANLALDQRAISTNTTHPVIYVAVHAASDGKGVRLYTALLPAGGENNGSFVAWDTAQARVVPISKTAAQAIAAEFQKRRIQVRTLAAPLRPLNNLTSAAIAVEVAPPGTDVMDLNLPAYQQNVVSAVVSGIVAVRDKLGGQP